MMKKALITGVTGQDGAYLSKLLIEKGYVDVVGVTRKIDAHSLSRLNYLGCDSMVELVECDLMDSGQVLEIIDNYKPDEVYNLAAQSSVGYSFEKPSDTFKFNTASVLNLLESIRVIDRNIRFYQASSSEMFGNVDLRNLPIKESLLFHPASPYGISKASAHWLTINYREAYGLFTACGILFNHESALRGENFVIKKIINTALKIVKGEAETLTLGNLAISRDWGYAPKYVEAMWKMLQVEEPDNYIICSGEVATLQDVVVKVFAQLNLDLKEHLRLDQNFMRSLDLGIIYGDNSKAKNDLDWNYDFSFDQLIKQLIIDEQNFINSNE